MEKKIKLLVGLAFSFALVLSLFLGVLIGLYLFTINAGNEFVGLIKELPLSYVLSIGGIATALSYIKRRYK